MRSCLPIPAVSAVIRNAQGQILLTKRSQYVREPFQWCVPGGHFDGGATWRTAMEKEVEEETGLRVLHASLLGLYSRPEITQTNQRHFVVATFLVLGFEGQLRPNREVTHFLWCEEGSLPSPLMRSTEIQIQDAFAFNGVPFVR